MVASSQDVNRYDSFVLSHAAQACACKPFISARKYISVHDSSSFCEIFADKFVDTKERRSPPCPWLKIILALHERVIEQYSMQ